MDEWMDGGMNERMDGNSNNGLFPLFVRFFLGGGCSP